MWSVGEEKAAYFSCIDDEKFFIGVKIFFPLPILLEKEEQEFQIGTLAFWWPFSLLKWEHLWMRFGFLEL